jgi:hypothetical protein
VKVPSSITVIGVPLAGATVLEVEPDADVVVVVDEALGLLLQPAASRPAAASAATTRTRFEPVRTLI